MSPSADSASTQDRFSSVAAFVGLSQEDRRLVRLSRHYLLPLLPELSRRIAAKILGNADTRRHFEWEGPADPAVVGEHLRRYIEGLVAVVATDALPGWLARVGPVHSPAAGDPRVSVPVDQMDAMLGFLTDLLTETIWGLDLPEAQRIAAIRAYGKLLWVQRAMMEPPDGAPPGPSRGP